MNYDILDQLICLEKKGEASKDKKKEYLSQMLILLSEEGFSENAERYVSGGFPFCGAVPIAEYMQNLSEEDRLDLLNRIIKSKTFINNDKTIAFKISISLLCQVLNRFATDLNLIERLINLVPAKQKNKEGAISKDNNKIIEKYFLVSLLPSAELPDLNLFKNSNYSVNKFCQIIKLAISEIKTGRSIDKIKDKVLKWISSSVSETKGVQSSEKNEGNNISVNEIKSEPPYKKISNIGVLSDIYSKLYKTADEIKTTVEAIKLIEHENIELKKQLNVLTDCLKIEKNTRKNCEETITELKVEITAKEHTVNRLNEEIEKLNSIISVYSEDKQSSNSEQLNAIASKLKSEYRDFKDAAEMEMTVELGENLRCQINTIFKILIKAGINIEGR